VVNDPSTASSTSVRSTTTGRRHVRAGSVHVAELISKGSLGHPPSSGQPHDDTPDAADGPGNRQSRSHRRVPSRFANLAKISALGIATLVLCASVALASMIAHHREATEAAHNPLPDLQITGARALLPGELTHTAPLVTSTATPDLPNPGSNPTNSVADAEPHQPPGQARKDPAAAKTQLVKRFYHLVLSQPEEAFRLLDARLPGRDLSTFVQSWNAVAELEMLDVRERGIDVLAVIRVRLTDGSRLQVRQSLEVSDAEPRRIVGARILAAQRTAK
jgi:hypothetical protein